MKHSMVSALRRAGVAVVSACSCVLLLSCAFGDEDAVRSLFQEAEDPLVVAVGDSSLYISPTGMLWSVNLYPDSDASMLRGAVFVRDRFIAVGMGAISPGVSYVSQDGVLWMGPLGISLGLEDIIAYKDYIIGVGSGISLSQDGMVWAELYDFKGDVLLNDVAVGNGLLVAVGSRLAVDGVAYASLDGVVWAGPAVIGTGIMDLIKIAYGNNVFVAISSSSYVAVSKDGIAWVLNRTPDSIPFMAIAFGGGRFVAVNSNLIAYISEDGVLWTRVGTIDSGGMGGFWIHDMQYCYGNFIGVGDMGVVIASPNGLGWRQEAMNIPASLWGIGCRK
ncbi:MAG: hypothetical protein JW807_10050 [Spirochaetes bacterium]|nr:hypothetical protein [Spirochaetota bacterium]